MKKIVVTGGSGGAGRYVVKALLRGDYEVLNLDRKAQGMLGFTPQYSWRDVLEAR